MLDTWLCDRLILEKVATLQELETWYSINDAADLTDALEAWREAEREVSRRSR